MKAPLPGSVVGALWRGFLLFSMSFSINILNVIVFLTVRPWSRLIARHIIGEPGRAPLARNRP
jgi:hypothetical protein